MKRNLLAMLAMLAACGYSFAQSTPVGVWKSIDDKTKAERSQVRISDSGGVLTGRIEKLLASDAKPDVKCDKCEDDRKDKPIVGMDIIRGVKKADADNTWDGGTILDPVEGKIYKVRLQTAEDGKKLEVRGYIGMPMLGRTQTWVRVE